MLEKDSWKEGYSGDIMPDVLWYYTIQSKYIAWNKDSRLVAVLLITLLTFQTDY